MAEKTNQETAFLNHSLANHLNEFSDGIFITDQAGLCMYTNYALCKMLGYDYSGALFNMNILDYVAPEFREDLRNALERSRNMYPGSGNICIIPLRKKNGKMILAEISLSFTKIKDHVISISAIVRNLSSRHIPKSVQEKLSSYYPDLAKYFPVTSISVKKEENELIGTVGMNKQELQLNVILQEIKTGFEKELSARNSRNLILSLTIPDPDPTRSITTDKDAFVHIIWNLLNFMVRISVSDQIEFGYYIEKGIYPLFFVRDFTREIKQDQLNQAYENLHELSHFSSMPDPKAIQELVHTQELIRMLNGSIWAKSGISENLVFYFHAGKEKVISHATIHGNESPDRSIEWASKNILVVEDLPNNYLYIEAILRKTGAHLIHATNGNDAVDIINSGQQIDLVLMDIRLPGMDGYETTRRIKVIKPDIPVIAVTAYSIKEEEDRIRRADIDGFVSKPIYSDDLISSMNEVMRTTPRKGFRLKKRVL